MFSILGGFIGLMLGLVVCFPRQIAETFVRSLDDCIEFFRDWLMEPLDSPRRTISSRSSIGPPGDWLTRVRSLLWPTRLARVRVPARRSTR